MYRAYARGIVLLVGLAVVCGCGPGPKTEAAKDQKVDEIVQKSAGDWSRVSQADRDYLIRETGRGDQQSAEMDLRARWGRMKGGPPIPGPPGQ
jgi:hypothetical protein